MPDPQHRVDVGRFRIWTVQSKDRLHIHCLLGDGEIKVVDGYAEWEMVARYRRRAFVEWSGSNPLLIEIPFLLNRWDDVGDGEPGEGVAIERDIRELEKMAGLTEEQSEPPAVWWSANSPHDHFEREGLNWVIESLEWGDAMRNSFGNIVRQAGVLQLRQWETDKFISTGAATVRKKKSKTKTEAYTVKKGDTLKSIAKRRLGKEKRWPEIRDLNKDKVRDPNKVLKVGLKLRIPKK